jgi:hypothetical protein
MEVWESVPGRLVSGSTVAAVYSQLETRRIITRPVRVMYEITGFFK